MYTAEDGTTSEQLLRVMGEDDTEEEPGQENDPEENDGNIAALMDQVRITPEELDAEDFNADFLTL